MKKDPVEDDLNENSKNKDEKDKNSLPEEKRADPEYKPYEPKNQSSIDKELYTMWIREELMYYMMFHLICLGYALTVWINAFITL